MTSNDLLDLKAFLPSRHSHNLGYNFGNFTF